MKRNKWTEKTIALLKELYPVETIAHTARMTGMCETAVKNMVRKLGLIKVNRKPEIEAERTRHVLKHYHDRSYTEIGRDLGVTRTTIYRIVVKLGMKRTKEEDSSMNSRIRNEMIRRERRRMLFGLAPITRLKVVSNRAKIQLRCKLKSIGYIVGKEHNIMYYSDSLERRDTLETNGLKLDLHFLPLPVETMTAI